MDAQRHCKGVAPAPQAHWSDRYLGRQYEDCGALAEDAARREFGRRISLPAPASSPRATSRLARDLAGEIAREIPDHSGCWLDGDAALLRPLGSRRLNGHHVGLLCLIAGGWHVLHWRPVVGAARTDLRRLAGAGYRLEGIYRWI